jgi:hypothetical protein
MVHGYLLLNVPSLNILSVIKPRGGEEEEEEEEEEEDDDDDLGVDEVGEDWIHPAWRALGNTVLNNWVA